MWDIIAALSVFKEVIPEYVYHILARWLSMTHLGSHLHLPIDEVLKRVSDNFPKVSSRLLHLLNIICRCIFLSELKSDELNCKLNIEEPIGMTGEQQSLWVQLLFGSEKELRERLVSMSFSAFLGRTTPHPRYWHPVGVAQMQQWVGLDHVHAKNRVKVLTSEVQKLRSHSCAEYEVEEQCSYCAASVPFSSPEIAFCRGSESSNGDTKGHKLSRCAVSMQVCPATPLWFCKCCSRQISKLPPQSFYNVGISGRIQFLDRI